MQTLTSKQFLCAMCEVSACTQGIQFSIHIYQGLKMLRRNLFLLLPLTMLIPNIVRSEELWTEEAEKRALETVRSIINKGFIPSAISGNLPLKVFLKYLEQNALYLKNYADVLSDLALKTSNREESDFLRKSSKEATALVEYTKELYEQIGKKKFPTIIKPCMENSEYIQFESNLVRNSSFSIGLASVYPCFWVYGEIGKAIQAKAILIENPYHSWLEGLGDPQYLKTVDQIRGFLNEHAVKLKKNEYFIADLIGLKVYTEDDAFLGTLDDVIQTGAYDVYQVVTEEEKEILIPAIRQCILEVDVEEGRMKVHLLEGLV